MRNENDRQDLETAIKQRLTSAIINENHHLCDLENTARQLKLPAPLMLNIEGSNNISEMISYCEHWLETANLYNRLRYKDKVTSLLQHIFYHNHKTTQTIVLESILKKMEYHWLDGDSTLSRDFKNSIPVLKSYLSPERIEELRYHTLPDIPANERSWQKLLASNSDHSFGLLSVVFNFLTIRDRLVASTVSRGFNRLHQKFMNKKLRGAAENQISAIKNSHPAIFIAMMGGIHNILKIPVISLGDQMGSTDYLDFRLDNETQQQIKQFGPLVRGYDCYNRAFYIAQTEGPRGNSKKLLTIFQRYSAEQVWEEGTTWMENYRAFNRVGNMRDENAPTMSYFHENPRSRVGGRGLHWFSLLATQGKAGLPVRYDTDCRRPISEGAFIIQALKQSYLCQKAPSLIMSIIKYADLRYSGSSPDPTKYIRLSAPRQTAQVEELEQKEELAYSQRLGPADA